MGVLQDTEFRAQQAYFLNQKAQNAPAASEGQTGLSAAPVPGSPQFFAPSQSFPSGNAFLQESASHVLPAHMQAQAEAQAEVQAQAQAQARAQAQMQAQLQAQVQAQAQARSQDLTQAQLQAWAQARALQDAEIRAEQAYFLNQRGQSALAASQGQTGLSTAPVPVSPQFFAPSQLFPSGNVLVQESASQVLPQTVVSTTEPPLSALGAVGKMVSNLWR